MTTCPPNHPSSGVSIPEPVVFPPAPPGEVTTSIGATATTNAPVGGHTMSKAEESVAVAAGNNRGDGPGEESSAGGNMPLVFRVKVPDNLQPGETTFQVYAGSRIVRVKCPPDSQPGQFFQITVPVNPNPGSNPAGGPGAAAGGPRLPHDLPNARRIEGSSPPAYMVAIPDGISSGALFRVTIQGQQLMVTCPPNARPGMSVRIVPPTSLNDVTRPPAADVPMGGGAGAPKPKPKEKEKTQLFEVEVPRGVELGAPFALSAGGIRVLVTCPPNSGPGERIRFKLPLALIQKPKTNNEAAQIKLKYDKDGWTRSVRATDLKFQWIRTDVKGDVDLNKRFHIKNSAYVRKLEFRAGDDPRIRTGISSLVPASEAVVDSKIKSTDGRDLVTYSDLAQAQVKNFGDKAQWFQDICAEQLCVEWNEGHMRMNVRRRYLLGDSVDAVMSLSRKDLQKLWRFEFVGETGMDAGGLAREWFELVTKEVFDPNMGLWISSTTTEMSMTLNQAGEFCCEDHLVYYRFLGRVMGKAMFDRQLVNVHMAKHIYKHILGWPVQFQDLESVDEGSYKKLKQLQGMLESGEDLSMLCLHFTTTLEVMGVKKEVALVKGGSDIRVTNDNFPEYVEACLKYKLMDCVKPQMNELLLGFFDVIPEPLLTIFDFQELELLMCGLPEIDIED